MLSQRLSESLSDPQLTLLQFHLLDENAARLERERADEALAREIQSELDAQEAAILQGTLELVHTRSRKHCCSMCT
jgi:hypothetical protein